MARLSSQASAIGRLNDREYAEGDALVPIDVDLQDPVDVIAQMIEC